MDLRQGIEIAGVGLEVRPIADVSEAKYEFGTMDVFAQDTVDVDKMEHGKVSAMGGAAAFEAVRKVIELALDKKIAVTVTGPINKEALNKAGYPFSGHTEMYAHFTNTEDYAMLLIHGNLRVIHVTTHVSLRQACDLVKKKRILR